MSGNLSNVLHREKIILGKLKQSVNASEAVYHSLGGALAGVPDSEGASVFAGVVGNLGLEYTFNIPLQISLDLRPRLMFGNNNVWTDGIFSFGIGVRYAF